MNNQVKTVSIACYGLCCWVHAIISYDKVAKVVAPKKQALKIAEDEVAGLMAILEQKRVSEIEGKWERGGGGGKVGG